MALALPDKPRAYVATRGGRFHGMIVGNAEAADLRQFYADFAGCDVRPVFTQEELSRVIASGEHA